MTSYKARLHNGGYSIIEHWVGPSDPGEAVRVTITEARSFFQQVLAAAMKVNNTDNPADISGQQFQVDELMGNVGNLPEGCIRFIHVDQGGYCSGIQFQNNGAEPPTYVDFIMSSLPNGANITIALQHSIIT